MSKHLQRDLDAVKQSLLAQGALVEEATNKAISALVDRRSELTDEVIAGDDVIDEREVVLEEDCLKILALHQPVATDLRFVITVLKVNNDLERMGDLALNIAKRAKHLAMAEPLAAADRLPVMADIVRGMLRDALDALVNQDSALARRVLARDDAVDDSHREMFAVMQDVMKADPNAIERGVNTISASRNLERIADLATNIAEDVIFLVEGEVIRHRYRTDDFPRAPHDHSTP